MKKALTMVEILISFSIALILLTSMYIIIYSNLKLSETSQYFIDANNILIFLSQEIQNNPSLYIKYESSTKSFSYDDLAIEKLRGKLQMYRYTINESTNYDLNLGRINKIPNIDNVLQIDISLSWKANNKNYRINSSIIVSTFDITQEPNINLPENSDI